MKHSTSIAFATVVFLALMISYGYSWDYSQPLIIDHTLTNLSKIPAYRIDSVQENQKLHYAHTSHGSQLTYGMRLIENIDAFYEVEEGNSFLPNVSGAFCIFNGQEDAVYITPELYWQTTEGLDRTRNVLNNNPTINTSMWGWCTQADYYTEAQVQAYLGAMSLLEAEFPNVVFVYMTGNAQVTGSEGLNRYLRNELIRQFCRENNKVLYDFADLDSWWFNPDSEEWEHSTFEYDGYTIPVEHPEFVGSEAYHTTTESCIQKARALWWLMSLLEGGGQGDTLSVDETTWSEVKDLYR